MLVNHQLVNSISVMYHEENEIYKINCVCVQFWETVKMILFNTVMCYIFNTVYQSYLIFQNFNNIFVVLVGKECYFVHLNDTKWIDKFSFDQMQWKKTRILNVLQKNKLKLKYKIGYAKLKEEYSPKSKFICTISQTSELLAMFPNNFSRFELITYILSSLGLFIYFHTVWMFYSCEKLFCH